MLSPNLENVSTHTLLVCNLVYLPNISFISAFFFFLASWPFILRMNQQTFFGLVSIQNSASILAHRWFSAPQKLLHIASMVHGPLVLLFRACASAVLQPWVSFQDQYNKKLSLGNQSLILCIINPIVFRSKDKCTRFDTVNIHIRPPGWQKCHVLYVADQ